MPGSVLGALVRKAEFAAQCVRRVCKQVIGTGCAEHCPGGAWEHGEGPGAWRRAGRPVPLGVREAFPVEAGRRSEG